MPRDESIDQIQICCKNIALQFMQIHPAVPALEDETTQADLLTALHAMTVQLELIKKKLIQLQNRDGSTEL